MKNVVKDKGLAKPLFTMPKAVEKHGYLPKPMFLELASAIGKYMYHPERICKYLHIRGANLLLVYYGEANTLIDFTHKLGTFGRTAMTIEGGSHEVKADLLIRSQDSNYRLVDGTNIVSLSTLLEELELDETTLNKIRECLTTL